MRHTRWRRESLSDSLTNGRRGRCGPQWIPTPVISTEQTLLDVCGRVTAELGVRGSLVRIQSSRPSFIGLYGRFLHPEEPVFVFKVTHR